MKTEGRKIPFKKAVVWILLSTLVISGSTAFGVLFWFHFKELRTRDDAYRIVKIVQSGPGRNSLSSEYLAELLGLSVDRPVNVYQFSVQDGKRKLLESPYIKNADVKKINPGTISIHYTHHKPVALLADYTNTTMDDEGVLFPVHPFFLSKKIPEIHIGGLDDGIQWGDTLHLERQKLALSLLRIDWGSDLVKIDVSKVDSPSYGCREIIVVVKERILRLNPDDYMQAVANYFVLHQYLQLQDEENARNATDSWITIDLRVPHLAYIRNCAKINYSFVVP